MRRKLYLGLALAAFAVLAGAFLFNQTIGAQDAPKKADPEQKKSAPDLFQALLQKVEVKPDTAPPPPSQPTPLPLPTAQPPGALPPMPTQAPPPNGLPTAPPAQLPPPSATPPGPIAPLPPATTQAPQPIANPPQMPAIGQIATPPPIVGTSPLPAQPPQAPAVDPIGPMPMQEPIKLKGSTWSLHVELVNGQTVVTATAHKKHEFKITCQHLDLQTGAGVMKAKGKVQIAGDALNGSCDQLILPLHDDRLTLEGGAEVRIQKSSGNVNVSDTRPAAFELKGDKLDLRISELQTAAFIETNWRKVSGDSSDTRAIPASMRPGDDAKKWTPYGTLRNTKSGDGIWSLVGSDGQIISYLTARDGGSLEQYVGRTIAVFGARDGERGGYPLLRVTHIAVP